jgi:uncharacterized protein YbjT (DUF2867 family)
MKIVVIGGSGLIGKKLVTRLHERGHEAVAASPSSGVNAVTGAGLADVLVDAEVVVDVTNSPSFEDAAVLEFFEKSSRNLLAAEADAGVGHHVAVSIVGADRIPDSGYLRAKVAQEKLIQSAGILYTILRYPPGEQLPWTQVLSACADRCTPAGRMSSSWVAALAVSIPPAD